MILKPGKSLEDPKSYRPISLLPIISKMLEKLFLRRLLPIIEERKIIPDHQFGFRSKHSTVDQIHRIVKKIHIALENKTYCSSAFLDVSQAFDKVWHEGLLFKIKNNLPPTFYQYIKSYLENFQIKYGETLSGLCGIKAGVPQGSVLRPILYLLYTFDIPITQSALMGTFADDTAILASHANPMIANAILQNNLNKISNWLKRWRIKVMKPSQRI